MKNIIYKLGVLLSAFAIVMSCTSPEAETNYTPASYEFPSDISLATGNITNRSFQLTYTNPGQGEGYFVVVESGSEAPTSNDVFDGTADGLITNGSFDLMGEPVVVTVDENLCDNSGFDVYAVHFTSDSFLSETTSKATLTTASTSLAGTYTTVTNGTLSGNFAPETTVTDFIGEVTITDNGDGTFDFDDATAGFYSDLNYYGGFGSPSIPHTFEVPCNDIEDSFDTPFVNCCDDVITFSGKINPDGTISVHWENGFGEIMDVVYTKK